MGTPLRVLDRSVLDLFSAAAGGWSLGMHRAGFKTVAACEAIAWRRALYSENNPGVPVYDDVCTLTADRLVRDLGYFPGIVVGSPPCQDISSANTKGKGVEGERSGLFFEAVRIIREGRPRWFALENSANLRTRGADAVLAALEALGYTCWTFVVGGDDIEANHERKRSWIVGVDLAQLDGNADGELSAAGFGPQASQGPADLARGSVRQVANRSGDDPLPFADADGIGRDEGRSWRRSGFDVSVSSHSLDPASVGHEGGRAWRHGADGDGSASAPARAGSAADADQAGQADGCLVSGVRQAEITNDGRSAGRSDDESRPGQMGLCEADRITALQHRADWSLADLADHLRLDDGLSAWLAGTRIAVGGPRGTSAASLIVEAFGDAVIPRIPEAIGRAIVRVETALAAVLHTQEAA